MANSEMSLAEKLDALAAAVASNGEAVALLKSVTELNLRVMAQSMTALTISLTEIIESEPERHTSAASEGRAEELYKLSVQQRRTAAAQADAELPAGTRSIASVGLG